MFNITSKTKKRIAKIGHGAVTLVSSFSIVVSSFTQVYAEALLIGDASAPGTGFITSSGNGTPVINIAPPQSGVSVNTYDDFNVDDKGLILNNSGVDGVSVIGAGVTANQRFVSEAANSGGIVTTAKTIVNEVTSASRSQINGQVEVFGDKAAVIIANPNGITCNGCDFINTSSSILTTGKPTINGSQVGLGVSKGTITIGPDGFKAGEQGGVFGRHVNINGAVSTNEQNPENTLVISGGVQRAGSLNFDKLSDTDIVAGVWTDAKTSPFAVDASEAGTLTSGEVRVVNVDAEKLGVNLYGEINAQSVEAHSTGHLFYRDITVTEGVTLYGGDIRQYGDLTAGGDVIINGDSFTLYDGRTLVTGQGEGVDGNVAITVKDFAVIAGEISGSTITLKALERAEGSDAPVSSITNNGFLLADGDFVAVAGVFKQERKIATEYDIYTDPVLKSYLQTYYAQLAAGGEQADIAATLIARAGAHEIIAEYIDDGATTSGTNVSIEATDGDILNKGGVIAATNNVVLKASENVINEFLALRSRLTAAEGCAGQNCGYKTDFHAAEILAGNDLTITAINGNIENRGSNMAAANNISLTAGNDIINSLKRSNYSTQQNVAVNIRYNVPIQSCHTGGKHDHVTTCTTIGYQTLQDWQLHGTEDNILAPGRIVSLYGNVTVDADRDFVSQGSEISAGRDIDIDADGQALFFSYTDDERNFVRYDKTINTNCNAKWGGCTQTTVQQTDNTYNLAVQNTDLIAETIDVDAKEDVVIIGSRFLASEDLDLTSATGNVLVGNTDYISSNDIAENQIIPVGTVDVPSTVKTQRGDVITFTKLEDAADIEDFQGQFVNETADYATFLEEDNLLTAVEALRRAESGADIKDAARSVGVQSFVSLIDSGALADLTTEANEAYTTLQTTLETGLGSLWDEISGYNVQVKTQTEALEALVADTVVGNAAQQAAIDAALVVVAGDYAAAKASHEQAYQNRLAAIRASYDHLLTHQVLRHRQQWFGGKQPGYRTVAYWATVPNAHYVNLKNAANQVALNNRTAALQTAATQNALDVAAATALYSDEALRNQIAALQAAFATQTAEYAAQIETVHTTFETQLVDATNVVQNLRDQEALEAELGSSFVAKGTVNAGAPSLAAALTADAFKANEWYKGTPKLPEIQATYDARVAANEQAYQQLTAYIRAWHAPHLAAAVQGGLVAIHTQFANSQTSQLNDAAQARANTLQSAVEQKNAAEAVAKSLAVNSDGILEFTAFTEEGTSKALISDDKATQDKFLDATAWRYATATGRKSRSPFNRLTAQEDLTIWAKNNALVAASDIDAKDQVTVTGLGGITAGDAAIRGTDIDLTSGGNFTAGDLLINSSGDTSITSFGATKISTIARNYTIGTPAANNILGTLSAKNWELRNGQNVTSHELSRINTGGDLKITSLGNLSLDGVQTTAGGNVSLTTNQNLNLTAPVSTITFKEGDVNNGTDTVQIISTPTYINSGGDFEAYAGNNAVLLGAVINADGALDLGAKNNVQLGARQNVYRYDYRYYKSSLLSTKSSRISQTHVTNIGTTLTAKGDVKVEAETGNLTTAGTRFTSTEGSVNLSATQGNIYAGTYTDTHDEQYINSSSSWGGLINSSSNTLINYTTQTGTAALAALNLSLQSGGNTTLIGTQLSAGQDLNINVGGDLRIEAAISSIRKEHFESKSGAVLATTLTENSEKETAAYTSFDAGGNLTVTVGGDTHVTLYRYEGEDTPELTEIYPEEIAALQALILHDQVLLDEYFFDETKALSPAFIAIATIAVTAGYGALLTGPLASAATSAGLVSGGSLTAAGNAVVAAAASATINIANGTVSGDLDMGKILKDAVVASGTSYLTASLNLQASGNVEGAANSKSLAEKLFSNSDEFGKIGSFNGILPNGFGSFLGEGSQLNLGSVLDGALDAGISNGINSVAYGTDFGKGFTSSLVRTVVSLGLADAQNGIGGIFEKGANGGEGSIGHILLHGTAGCAAAELQGASCGAGAAGGIAQGLYAGYLNGKIGNVETAQLLGALAGYVFSGGDAENVSVASAVANSAYQNNYLKHTEWTEYLEKMAGCSALSGSGRNACISRTQTEYNALSRDNTAEYLAGCTGDSAACAKGLLDLVKNNLPIDLQDRIVALGPENFHKDWPADPNLASAKVLQALLGPDAHLIASPDLIESYASYSAASCASAGSRDCLNAFQQTAPYQWNKFWVSANEIGMILAPVGAASAVRACLAGGNVSACGVAGIEVVGGKIVEGATVLVSKGTGLVTGVLRKTDEGFDVVDNTGQVVSVATNRPVTNIDNVNWQHVDGVIAETNAGIGNLTSSFNLNSDEALETGLKWLGDGYREIAPGVFRNADNSRQFRIDSNSLAGNHAPNVPHLHLETVAPNGRTITANNHIPLAE
ncbi:filamentous hemagglutinin N-terminal domain-containing protein [Roseovarius sp. EL26]|uniref:two-partner secretion domain-containing protein n=1 Tax=Roseovarius sp. EL26 TaxID=2126672 RepID=UPI0013C401E3|nr:filamentous hemagglutinin N-terminal domain-containing protein [Roseovarius sp. EL26]